MAFPITAGGATIQSLVQNGGAINTSMIGACSTAQAGLTSTAGLFASVGVGAAVDTSGFSGMANQLTTFAATNGPLDTLSTHAASLYSNLADNAGLYISQLNLQQGLQNVGSSLTSLSGIDLTGNPCAGLNTFFGSIIGAGEGLLQTITGAVQEIEASLTALIQLGESVIQSAIDAAVSTISGLISTIATAATSIVTMVANEVSALANALADLINYGIGSALNTLFSNPCGRELLQAVGSTGLLTALGA